MPHPRGGTAIERVGQLIQAVLRLADDAADHLPVRLDHLELNRLIGQRFAVTVAQQPVEYHRFTGAIKIARAKHKELLTVAGVTGNVELGQVQRGKFEIQQRGLPLFARQQQRRVFIRLEGRMAFGIAGRLRQRLAFIVKQGQFYGRLRRAVFQALGENVQLAVIAVQRNAHIAEGKQRSGIAVAVLTRRIHHRNINA